MSNVVYLWDAKVSTFSYGDASQHPMKPLRLQMVHELLRSLDVLDHLHVVKPPPIPSDILTSYHARPYIDFLRSANCGEVTTAHSRVFQFSGDCPPFEGVFDFSSGSAAGSVAGAVLLNNKKTDVAINWSGGLHHAKRLEASGFCYINDIVLAILELLKEHRRVLYIDIDVHHGDGVEEAFYTSDRVFTLSFHKGDNFFPGTGKRDDIGLHAGRYYSANVPIFDGVTDDQYYYLLFRPILRKVIEVFSPNAIVMQCGADSLGGDRIGTFNMSSICHSRCVEFARSFQIPMLVLGGGGYTVTNVARCWAMETAMLAGCPVEAEAVIPTHSFSHLYGKDATMCVESEHSRKNENSNAYIDKVVTFIMAQLHHVGPPPNITESTTASSYVQPSLFD
eukprot:PhF_6_TR35050/c0_g1_i1/m.51073/K06067/HDAC1_2; histone deacetylase 1/2